MQTLAALRRAFFVYSVRYRTDSPEPGAYKLPVYHDWRNVMLLLSAAIAAGVVAGFALAAIMVKAMFEYPAVRSGGRNRLSRSRASPSTW
jgi:hypothetical protein